jgi:hypothetical protein
MKHSATMNCDDAVDSMRAYLEGELPADAKVALLEHVNACASCKQDFDARRQVISALSDAYSGIIISKGFDDQANSRLNSVRQLPTGQQSLPTGANAAVLDEDDAVLAGDVPSDRGLMGVFGAAPWWAVSIVLHLLIILLATLVSMTMELPPSEQALVTVTELAPAPLVKPTEEKKPSETRNALQSTRDTPPTDPSSKEMSEVTVPKEILELAELGDHFETNNPDRPDTGSAFGNPDAHSFHSVQGSDDAEGGGGNGGTGMEDMIGVGGASSPGEGGGWGGGKGTGTGVGVGSGHGSFGSRNGGGRKLMVKRHGGSKATEGAVDMALEWLAKHQEVDGHWDCQKYEGRDDGRCKGINGDAAVTGFAVLAFLGAGHTTKVGKYRDNVQRGVYWLMQKLDECEKTAGPGRWCSNHGSNYTQGVATLALAEACGMSPRDGELKISAQKAIDGVVFGQIKKGDSEYEAWDYAPKGMTNDTSVTGWNIMALKAAKVAQLKVDHFSIEGAMRWIDAGQDLANAPKQGGAEYWEGGRMTYRGTCANTAKGQGTDAVMSAATLTRLMVGGQSPDHPGIAGPCNLMRKPEHLPNKWPGNLYYWYYGSLTMFQKGGDHWKEWNEPMKDILPKNQRRDGDFNGSWDPFFTHDTGYIYGGRVMQTALGALCLEVYYRYQKLNN